VGGESPPIILKADLTGWDKLRGSVAVHTQLLDLSEILLKRPAANTTSGVTKSSGFIDDSDIKFDAVIEKCFFNKVIMSPVTVTGKYYNGCINIKQACINLNQGTIEINGEISPDHTTLESKFNLFQYPFNNLLSSIDIFKSIKVRNALFSAKGHLVSKGKTLKDIRSSLHGNFKAKLEKGYFTQTSIVFKILSLIDLKKFFKTPVSDLSSKGLYFESIQATAEIENGIIHTDDGFMRSPLANLAAMGSINLANYTIDGTVAVELLRTLRKITDKVPFAAKFLTGKSHHLASYYFEIKGPLNKPEIKSAALKHLKKTTVNRFKSLLNLPGSIFKKKSGGNDNASIVAPPLS
jgi:hypothetical protein